MKKTKNYIEKEKLIDKENQKLKVNVNMFGRDMPIDLEFIQVRKI